MESINVHKNLVPDPLLISVNNPKQQLHAIVVKSKLPPRSGSSLEADEPAKNEVGIRSAVCEVLGSQDFQRASIGITEESPE